MDEGKIGVITLYGQNNYGNRLQNYATIIAYKSFGYEAESLIFIDKSALSRVKRFVKSHITASNMKEPSEANKRREVAFKKFSERISARRIDTVDGLSDSYRFFSVGSDQVWNPNYIKGREWWFYLSFCPPEKRIALSPSIGLDKLTKTQSQKLAAGIKGFPSLSVREERGARLIKECSAREAQVLCDPTLTISADSWHAVSEDYLTPRYPYVFTYILGDADSAYPVLEEVTKRRGLRVVGLTDRFEDGELPAGPSEFISLIEHADHVVTDSFHAAVFSSIFQRPLTIVKRQGSASMFSRLDTLAQTLGIEHKIYGSRYYDSARASDYAGVSAAIERERVKFMNYLKSCTNA